jgi:hypothetical protein
MCQRMDIKNRKRRRKKKLCFFSFVLSGTRRLVRRRRRRKKKRRTRDYDSYMIRVGSVNGCCCCDVTDREATAVLKDVDGVLNGDCLLQRSGGVASEVY